MAVGSKVCLYGGEGGRGVVVEMAEQTAKVRFTDGAEVWCSIRNLSRIA